MITCSGDVRHAGIDMKVRVKPIGNWWNRSSSPFTKHFHSKWELDHKFGLHSPSPIGTHKTESFGSSLADRAGDKMPSNRHTLCQLSPVATLHAPARLDSRWSTCLEVVLTVQPSLEANWTTAQPNAMPD
ncbi:unnamed protein product [Protopolystoma xenopodis]|uniref:Uncharacterized protein n=1 Tax=Protopolystoma xenopodis TaxID=117903 RepID=A0A3S5AX07_9PLAT|nr:unnamed protein product [Protopolystoma xenopodis]